MPSVAASVTNPTLSETAYFSVYAAAEPGVMPRVLALFAKRGLVPSWWRSALLGTDQAELAIEIEMRGLASDAAEYIAACLRQIASVEIVSTCRADRSAAGRGGAMAINGVP